MKKVGTFLLTLALLHLLMVIGLVGYLTATGRLDGAKATVILDMLRQSGTPAKLRDQVAEAFAPEGAGTGTAPATMAAGMRGAASRAADGSLATVATASDRITYAEQAMEKERMRLEMEAQNLRRQQEVLEKERRAVEEKLGQIQKDRTAFEQAAQAAVAKAKDENFTRAMALYDELKTKQVKDIFLTMSPEVVADFVRGMEAERASKIIGEFKTPEERKFITDVLEKIRTDGTPSARGTSAVPATLPAASDQARS